jgi:hypothetical protein
MLQPREEAGEGTSAAQTKAWFSPDRTWGREGFVQGPASKGGDVDLFLYDLDEEGASRHRKLRETLRGGDVIARRARSKRGGATVSHGGTLRVAAGVCSRGPGARLKRDGATTSYGGTLCVELLDDDTTTTAGMATMTQVRTASSKRSTRRSARARPRPCSPCARSTA